MNKSVVKKVLALNLAFWGVAIAFPIIVRLIPIGSGAPPKIFELFIPLFQVMLACGATYLVKTSIENAA